MSPEVPRQASFITEVSNSHHGSLAKLLRHFAWRLHCHHCGRSGDHGLVDQGARTQMRGKGGPKKEDCAPQNMSEVTAGYE